MKVDEVEDFEKYKVGMNYQYETDEINKILLCRVQEVLGENLKYENAVIHVNYPMYDQMEIEGKIMQGKLLPTIQDKKKALEKEKDQQHILLIPYNLGNYHWVGILLAVHKDGRVFRAEYIDSLNGTTEVFKAVQEAIQTAYGDVTWHIRRDLLKQDDGISCGVYTIENLIHAIKGLSNDVQTNVETIRRMHLKALDNAKYATYEDFSYRQRYNIPSQATLSQSRYPVPPSNDQDIISQVLGINSYLEHINDKKAKKDLYDVFRFQKKYENATKEHLDVIRNTLKNIAFYLTSEEDKGAFKGFIGFLFGIQFGDTYDASDLAAIIEGTDFTKRYESFLCCAEQYNSMMHQAKGVDFVVKSDDETIAKALQQQEYDRRSIIDPVVTEKKALPYTTTLNPVSFQKISRKSAISDVSADKQNIVRFQVRNAQTPQSEEEKSQAYEASGLKNSLHGNIYQLKLNLLFLHRGLQQDYTFQLATEMNEAEKFDDIVFKYRPAGSSLYSYRFLQAKHRQDDNKLIKVKDFLDTTDGDFSLLKYFISYLQIKKNLISQDSQLEELAICTNAGLDFYNKNGEEKIPSGVLEEINISDPILSVSHQKAKKHKFNFGSEWVKEKIYPVLYQADDVNLLAKELIKNCNKPKSPTGSDKKSGSKSAAKSTNKSNTEPAATLTTSDTDTKSKISLTLKTEIIKRFHKNLVKEVLVISTDKANYMEFSKKIIEGNENALSPFASKLRKALLDKGLNLHTSKFKVSDDFGGIYTDLQLLANKLMGVKQNDKLKFEKYIKKYQAELNNQIFSQPLGPLNKRKTKKDQLTRVFSEKFINTPDSLSEFGKQLRAFFTSDQLVALKDTTFHVTETFINHESDQSIGNEEFAINEKAIEEITEKDIQDFFDHLVLAVNQPNEVVLGESITKELGQVFNLLDGDLMYTKMEHEVLNWMKQKQGITITKKEVEHLFKDLEGKINKLQLAGLTKDYCEQLAGLRVEYHKSKDVINFLEDKNRYFLHLITQGNPVRLGAARVCQTLINLGWKQDDSHVFIPLATAERQKELLDLVGSRLIVLVDDGKLDDNTKKNLIAHLKQKASIDQKVIVMSDQKFNSNEESHTQQDQYVALNAGFRDLQNSSKDSTLNMQITYAGKPSTLKAWIADTAREDVIDAVMLNSLLEKKKVEMDGFVQAIPNEFFIDRKRYLNIIDKACLQTNATDVFVLSQISEADFKNLVDKQANIFSVSEDLYMRLQACQKQEQLPRYILLTQAQGEGEVAKLYDCYNKSDYNKNNTSAMHWLSYQPGQGFVWEKSYGNIYTLRNHISRDASRASDDWEGMKHNHRVSILTGEPGMGKSTISRALGSKINDQAPEKLAISIPLLDLIDKIKHIPFDSLENVVRFLAPDADEFSKKMLAYYLTMPNKVTIMLDGLDEVTAEREKIKTLIHWLKDHTQAKVVVTTRLQHQEELENEYNTFAATLAPLKEQEVKGLMELIWKKELKVESFHGEKFDQYASALLAATQESMPESENWFGIPLQTKLLAEFFKDDFIKFHQGETAEPKLLEIPSLFNLFDHSISSKVDLFMKEKARFTSYGNEQWSKDILSKGFYREHTLAALQLLCPTYQPSKEVNQAMLVNAGLINQYVAGTPIFTHRTYAEYLVANFFIKHLNKITDHPKYKKSKDWLVRNIFKSKYKVVRNFIEERAASDDVSNNFSKAWQQVVDAVLNKWAVKEGDKKIKIAYSRAEESDDEVLPTSFEALRDQLKNIEESTSNISISHLVEVCNQIDDITDVTQLEDLLRRLAKIANGTTFNKAKLEIMRYAIRWTGRYVRKCGEQNAQVQSEVLSLFAQVQPFKSTYNIYSRGIEDGVQKRVDAYNELQTVLLHNKDEINVLDDLSNSRLLYLSDIYPHHFSVEEIECFAKCYDRYKKDSEYRDEYLKLFFKVNQNDRDTLNYVASFLQQKGEDLRLAEFCKKYYPIEARKPLIEGIVMRQSERGIQSLENVGMQAVLISGILTCSMAEIFNQPLDGFKKRSNGVSRIYCENVRKLLTGLLARMGESHDDEGEIIFLDPKALCTMCTNFMPFFARYSSELSTENLQSLLKVVENRLINESGIAIALSETLNSLITIIKSTDLKLIDTGSTLLIQDPNRDFEYEMELHTNQQTIKKLLRSDDLSVKACFEALSNSFQDLKISSIRRPNRLTRSLSGSDLTVMNFRSTGT